MISIISFPQVSLAVSCDPLNHSSTGVKAMYFNLSGIFSNNTVTSAEMNSNSIITAAVVSQKFKVVTLCKLSITL